MWDSPDLVTIGSSLILRLAAFVFLRWVDYALFSPSDQINNLILLCCRYQVISSLLLSLSRLPSTPQALAYITSTYSDRCEKEHPMSSWTLIASMMSWSTRPRTQSWRSPLSTRSPRPQSSATPCSAVSLILDWSLGIMRPLRSTCCSLSLLSISSSEDLFYTRQRVCASHASALWILPLPEYFSASQTPISYPSMPTTRRRAQQLGEQLTGSTLWMKKLITPIPWPTQVSNQQLPTHTLCRTIWLATSAQHLLPGRQPRHRSPSSHPHAS